jgi:hypothetical protein
MSLSDSVFPWVPLQASPVSRREQLVAELYAMERTLRLARTLVESHRNVDLAGLEERVGRLCAAALDLPPEEGQGFRVLFASVLAEIDALAAALMAAAPR